MTAAGFGFVPDPLPMRNRRNAVVYYLVCRVAQGRRSENHLGLLFARELRRRRLRPRATCHLDEMAAVIAGTQFWLWRAFDDKGEVLGCESESLIDLACANRMI
jgi:hypothetical protein